MSDVQAIRTALAFLPEVAAQTATTTPDLRSIYTARSHAGAIDPTREIVVGDRGVGKSFWSSVLKDDAARTAVAPIYKQHKLDKLWVVLGFAEDISRKEYPSSRIIRDLMKAGVAPETIWRAVILGGVCHFKIDGWSDMSWVQRCGWISQNSEIEERLLRQRNDELISQGRSLLIIFDALDRLGQDWSTIRQLTKALLSTILEMRSFSNIRAKLFLRPDMDGDREIWTIRDGSKLRQNHVSLSWSSSDLFGFVWHWLLHQPETRAEFAAIVKSVEAGR